MLRVKIKFVSGYCMHPVASIETCRRIVPPRVLFWAHLLVPDVEAGSSSVQFSCSAVVMILCTASSGGSVVFKQRVMDGGGGFQAPSVDSSVPKDSMPSQVAV